METNNNNFCQIHEYNLDKFKIKLSLAHGDFILLECVYHDKIYQQKLELSDISSLYDTKKVIKDIDSHFSFISNTMATYFNHKDYKIDDHVFRLVEIYYHEKSDEIRIDILYKQNGQNITCRKYLYLSLANEHNNSSKESSETETASCSDDEEDDCEDEVESGWKTIECKKLEENVINDDDTLKTFVERMKGLKTSVEEKDAKINELKTSVEEKDVEINELKNEKNKLLTKYNLLVNLMN